jgi:hypothetical protein|tara:strand:+ start:1335 stop:1559 length:225 start_codon:yes stop_codon:yes gene_type:complete
MVGYLVTLFDLDDITFHLLTQEQYNNTLYEEDLEEFLNESSLRSSLFRSPAELVKFCVKNNIQIKGDDEVLVTP